MPAPCLGPWLLYDNVADPYQLENLVGEPEVAELQMQLDQQLDEMLERFGDAFLSGDEYLEQWGYEVDGTGTVPFTGYRV